MASPPRFKRFASEDFPGAPGWFESLLVPLNEVLGGLVEGVTKRLTRDQNFLSGAKTGIEFTTDATGLVPDLLAVKNILPIRPSHCWVTSLDRVDGAAITAAWSMTWVMDQGNTIRLSLQGLSASTKYRMSVVYE